MDLRTEERYGARERCGLVLGPALFAAVLFLPESFLARDARIVAAVTALMAALWVCESVPLAVTALLPLALFPVLGAAPIRTVAASYAAPEIFLFMGGFFMAVAMQRWNLHRRIALGIVCCFGCAGPRIVLGFMIATAAISLWVSNTATAMMMLPIALAVLRTLEERGGAETPGFEDFRAALLLSIAYGASIGGVGTLIGTPPNLVFASQVRSLYPGAAPVSFVRWMGIGLPFVAVFLPLAWFLLTRVALRGSRLEFGDAGAAIRAARSEFGPMSRGERAALAVFLAAVGGWVTRGDIAIGGFTLRGWESLAGLTGLVHDATVAIAAAVALFAIPVDWRRGVFVLDWRAAREIPWGILILFGGGIALGTAFLESGLAARIAGGMSLFARAPLPLVIALAAGSVTMLTEITSNTAVATIMLPVLGSTAVGFGVHPFCLMIPAAISASCAFMLPVATPPNAIMFSSGMIPIVRMVRIGLFMNLIGIVLVTLLMYVVAVPLFGLRLAELPAWAHP